MARFYRVATVLKIREKSESERESKYTEKCQGI